MVVLPLQIARSGKAQPCRQRRGGMPGAIGVVGRFLPLGEAGDALILPQHIHPAASAGQYLVRVALMAYVKDKLVLGA